MKVSARVSTRMSSREGRGRSSANPPVLKALRADAAELARLKGSPPGRLGRLADLATLPGMWTVAIWRLSNAAHERGLRPLSRLGYIANMVLFSAELQPGAVVGPGVVMPHPPGVGIASGVVMGERCRIMGLVRIGGSGRSEGDGMPALGDGVWLLDGAGAFGPITIGERSVVGARVTVGRDVPAHTLVLPAKEAAPRFLPRRESDLVAE